MEMEEVRAAILMSTKKAVASATPMLPMVANRAGSTVKIRVSSERRPPELLKIATPRASATYMAGKIRKPASTAMPMSTSAT